MSDVDLLQNTAELMDQRAEEAAAAEREALAAELRKAPLADTAAKARTAVTAKLAQVGTMVNMRVGALPDVQELAVSLIEVGQLNPPNVRETGNEHQPYELVAGRRRFAAMKLVDDAAGEELDWTFTLVKGISKREALVVQFAENFHQAKPEPVQFARAVRAIMIEDPDLTAADVSRMVGAPTDWTRKALRLLDLPESIVERVEAGDLSMTAADLVRRQIAKGAVSEEEASELVEQHAEGALSGVELKHGVGYVPPAPENYEEISQQLDESRWAAQKGAKNDTFSVGSDAEQADWDSADIDTTPSFSANVPSAGSVSPDAPASAPAFEDVPQVMEMGDMEVSGEDLDAYLLGRLLADVAPDEHRENLGISDAAGATYRYAFELNPAERVAALRNVALRLLAEDPEPPRQMHHHLQDA